MTQTDAFFRPSVTVDVLVLRWYAQRLELLLIQRARDPFAGAWALPGGFIEPAETLLASAQRELQEETGLSLDALHFFGVYGDPGRDPRGRTLTVAYRALLLDDTLAAVAADDAQDARWFAIEALPELAFDHARVVEDGLHDLRAELQGVYPSPGPTGTALPPEIHAALRQRLIQA
ncbi:MAG: NUDIX domain-containing protein [Candidatus Sericytochromatia bacterium]